MPYPDYYDPRDLQRLAFTFEKGLLETQEQSKTPVGYAVQLENWRPEPDGGLRARVGWTKGSTTGITVDGAPRIYSTRKIRGIQYSPFSAQRYVVAMDNSNNEITFFHIGRATIAAGAWTNLGNVAATPATVPVDMVAGLGRLWATCSSFAAVMQWDGAAGSFSAVAGTPAGARAVAFWRNRIWAAGPTATPYRVYYSALDSATQTTPTDWPASNLYDFGRDDGEVIEDITEFADMLVVGKQNSVWLLGGRTPDEFSVQPMPYSGGTSPGAAQGRSLLGTPYGCVIVGNENVWLFDGQSARVISQPIEGTFAVATTSWVHTAYIDGKCYITDNVNNRVYVYDFDNQTWAIETFSSAAESPAVLLAHFNNLLMGPNGGTVGSLLNYRALPSATRIKDYGVAADVAESFVVKTPEVWPNGALRPSTFRHVEIRLRQRVAAGAIALALTATVDGVAQTPANVTIPGAAGTYRYRLDYPGVTGYSFQLAAAHSLAATQGPIFDIEELAVLFEPEGFR